MIFSSLPELLAGDLRCWEGADADWNNPRTMLGTAQCARQGFLQETADFIAGLPDFQHLRRMCDLGGGLGEYSLELLRKNAELHADMVDLPAVAEQVMRDCLRCGIEQAVPGNHLGDIGHAVQQLAESNGYGAQ